MLYALLVHSIRNSTLCMPASPLSLSVAERPLFQGLSGVQLDHHIKLLLLETAAAAFETRVHSTGSVLHSSMPMTLGHLPRSKHASCSSVIRALCHLMHHSRQPGVNLRHGAKALQGIEGGNALRPEEGELTPLKQFVLDQRWLVRQLVEDTRFNQAFLGITILNTLFLALTYDGTASVSL